MKKGGAPAPRLGRSTGAWLAVLALGMAAILWQALRPATRAELAEHDAHGAAGTPLIAVAEADWSAVDMVDTNGRQRFERDPAGHWFLHTGSAGDAADHTHRSAPAEAARIAAVFATFSRARIERTLAAEPAQLGGYGLGGAQRVVLVYGRDARAIVTLEIGQVAPDGLSRYVRVSQAGGLQMIPNYQIEGLLGLIQPAPATEQVRADQTVRPPSTGNSTPVMNSASSLAK